MGKYKVLGICTDSVRRGGKLIYDKKGNRKTSAVGWYRVKNALPKLGATIVTGVGVKTTAENAMYLKSLGDIWFCKIADNEGIDHIYGAHKDFTGAKFVLDLDDDPDHVNPDHPDFKLLEEKKPMRLRMVKMADHIVVATEEIKQSIEYLNPYITVIPNAIDPAIWKVKRKRRKDGKIKIVWISSGSHFADLDIVESLVDPIKEKYPNVEFHLAGMFENDVKGDRIFHHMGTDGYDEFPQFFADLDPDIAIAALNDNQFNRCKSNIKWMEAAMLKVPVVASDVTPYHSIKHGRTGYLAKDAGQFVKYLSWLIEDEVKRKEMGKAAYDEVMANWTTDKVLPLYTKLFDKLMEKKDITVITAITGGKDKLKPQPEYPGVQYMAFLDKEVSDSNWITKRACDKFKNPVMNAKIHKILSHKYCDTPYIVWMDGNCTLKQDPHELIKLMGKTDYAFFKHPGRDCLYEEAEACVQLEKGDVLEIAEQLKQYAKDNFPENKGLCECTCFIRKNNPKANEMFEKWWMEITRYSERDQLSFPVVFENEQWGTIPGSIGFLKDNEAFPGNKYFKWSKHKK